jgi:hypothetical protein
MPLICKKLNDKFDIKNTVDLSYKFCWKQFEERELCDLMAVSIRFTVFWDMTVCHINLNSISITHLLKIRRLSPPKPRNTCWQIHSHHCPSLCLPPTLSFEALTCKESISHHIYITIDRQQQHLHKFQLLQNSAVSFLFSVLNIYNISIKMETANLTQARPRSLQLIWNKCSTLLRILLEYTKL